MTSVMSPDSSYGGRYDVQAPAPTPHAENTFNPAHREREPELHIGLFNFIIFQLTFDSYYRKIR